MWMKNAALSLLTLGLMVSTQVATSAVSQPQTKSKQERDIVTSDAFLSGHPDLEFRVFGIKAMRKGNFSKAAQHFKSAAKFADKPSQSMLGELLWEGSKDIPKDRVLAYVWMDLAAERLYPKFIARREYFWKQLTAEERDQALKIGASYYDQYGDAVAKPRQAEQMRRNRRELTGSRVGGIGALDVLIPGPGDQPLYIKAAQFYHDKYWQPSQYWYWTDEIWEAPSRGQVEVEPLIPVTENTNAKPNESAPKSPKNQ